MVDVIVNKLLLSFWNTVGAYLNTCLTEQLWLWNAYFSAQQ